VRQTPNARPWPHPRSVATRPRRTRNRRKRHTSPTLVFNHCCALYRARSMASLAPNAMRMAPVVASMARLTRGCVIHVRNRPKHTVTLAR
jgi:hypothetical protein